MYSTKGLYWFLIYVLIRMGIKCSYCTLKPVYIHNHNRYCKNHFIRYFEKKVLHTIKKYNLIGKKDRVVVACSGGKDSTATLFVLNKYFKNVQVIAIDEGIKGYRSKTLADLQGYCEKNSIKLNIYSFKEEFGFHLDRIKDQRRICMHCGVLRRYLLNKKSKGFDKLVTGHNLDDEAQSILMNLFKTNINSLIRLGPVSGVARDPKFVPRVKPLYLCSEKESFVYSHLKQFGVRYIECPYASSSFRAVVRDSLNNYEQIHPGSKMQLVENFLWLLPKLKREYSKHGSIGYCSVCGEPSTTEVCNACSIVNKFIH